MILIADSGSTKTNWKLISENNNVLSFDSVGLNPIFMDSIQIASETGKLNFNKTKVKKVFFYGASCSSNSRCSIVEDGLKMTFKNAIIEVNHDMLGAARSLYKNKTGLVGILGTGSNSCLYNGKNIIYQVGGLGFILGDEGSGADLGKRLIKNYMLNNLNSNIKNDFDKEFNLSRDEIIKKVYKEQNPNRFLASFAKFILKNKNDNIVNDLIHKSFFDYFNLHYLKFKNYKSHEIRLTGSIAYNFKNEIIETANKLDLYISEITNFPIDGLVDFHLKN